MLCFLFSALVVLLDQLFKRWITLTMVLYEQKTIIPGIAGLTYVRNPNAALSIDLGGRWVLAAIMFVLVVILITILLRYNEGFWGTLGLAAVLGGAVGNLIDRVFQGEVVDMFEFLFVNFAVFNIADIFITLGGITFCVFFISSSLRRPEKAIDANRRRSVRASGKRSDDGSFDDDDYDDDYEEDLASEFNDSDASYGDGNAKKRGTSNEELFLDEKPAPKPYLRPMTTAEPAPSPEDVNPFLTPRKQKSDSASPRRSAPPLRSLHTSPQTSLKTANLATASAVSPSPSPSPSDSLSQETPDELSLLLRELETLEAELEIADAQDYDIDSLLREYGFEDE